MSYDDLAIFVTAAQSAGFTEAARRLALPASRISRRIAELERQLGVRLFERTTRRVRLTAEGRELLDRCNAPVEALEAILPRGTQLGRRLGGTVHVTAPPLAVRSQIGPRLLGFMEKHPDISVELSATNATLDFVRDHVDLAFRLGPFDDSDLIVRPLWPVPYMLCASPTFVAEHRLSGRAAAEAIRGLPAIMTGHRWLFAEAPSYVPATIRHRIDDLETALAAVRRGFGIAFLPRSMLSAGVAEVTVDGLTPITRVMTLVYPSRRLLPARVRALIDHMIDTTARAD